MHEAELDELGKLEKCTLRCGICKKASWVVTKKSAGGTGNYIDHMTGRHGGVWAKAKRAEAVALGMAVDGSHQDISTMLVASPSFDFDVFYEKIGRWFVLSNQPFSEIESDELRDLLTYLKPALRGKIVGRTTLRDKIVNDLYPAHQAELKAYLQAQPGAIAIAGDCWTSSNGHAFLAVVGSWITNNWTLETGLLNFIELHGAHTGDNIGQATFDSMKDHGIIGQMISQTTDSASNNDTGFAKLSALISESGITTKWNLSESQIRCLAHIIHLAVMDLLLNIKAIPPDTPLDTPDPMGSINISSEEAEELAPNPATSAEPGLDVDVSVDLSSAFDKLRKISKVVRSSPQRLDVWYLTIQRIEDGKAASDPKYQRRTPKRPIIDSPTRWGSLGHMLERGLEFRDAIDHLCDNNHLKIYTPYKISEEEWRLIAHVLGWLKVFRSASDRMAGQEYPTLSFALITYVTLLRHIDNISKSPSAIGSAGLRVGVEACKAKLLKFFDKSTFESELYYIATVLDPRFKVSLFRNNPEYFSDTWVTSCQESMLDRLAEDYPAIDQAVEMGSSLVDVADEFANLMNGVLGSASSTSTPPTSATQELQIYLGEPVFGGDPLAWWKVNGYRFPSLARLARDVLAIPGSSVSVERVLSIGRDVISLRRASLSAETITALMNLRSMMLLKKRYQPQSGHKRPVSRLV